MLDLSVLQRFFIIELVGRSTHTHIISRGHQYFRVKLAKAKQMIRSMSNHIDVLITCVHHKRDDVFQGVKQKIKKEKRKRMLP